MKRFWVLCESMVLICCTCLSLHAGTNETKKWVTRQLTIEAPFNGIDVSSGIDVVYTQTSGNVHMELTALEDVIERISIEVHDKTLYVKCKPKMGITLFSAKHKARLQIAAPAITAYKARSSASIVVKYGLKTDQNVYLEVSSAGLIQSQSIQCANLFLESSSSSDISLEKVQCQSLNAKASSSGSITVEKVNSSTVIAEASSASNVTLLGTCQEATLRSSSASDIDAGQLQSMAVTAQASSAAKIECHAIKKLDATTSSAGSIVYSGNAQVNINKSSKGIKRK